MCLWVAIAIAILKYRLYEIDIVISKAVLYGSLAVFITAVYAGLVVGVGTLAGGRDSPLLAALAAAVVAVAFQPVRQRAGRLANRVVYGRRATPYQVLSDFAQRIGGTYAAEDVLPQMAQIVAAGTGAERVVVWLRVGDELRPEASSDGSTARTAAPRSRWSAAGDQAMPPVPGADLSVPVVHQGELLGAISIRMPKDEPLRPAGEQLVADVASQAGLVLSNAGLIEDLRASRQRLVTAQDEARRRLERNIHDGAQQDLVALGIKLRLAGDRRWTRTRRRPRQMLRRAAGRRRGRAGEPARPGPGHLPAAAGRPGAGRGAQRAGRQVAGPGDGRGRRDRAVRRRTPRRPCTSAAWRRCRTSRNTPARRSARICLRAQNGTLRFTVSDDGAGYDARHTPMGSGQRNMADRLAALGGRLEVRSAPGQGTTITAQLPSTPDGSALPQAKSTRPQAQGT